MKDLIQEINKLDKLWREVEDSVIKQHQEAIEKAILRWIDLNVKEGMIFWFRGYTGISDELEFKK